MSLNKFNLQETIALLERTPAVFNSLLRGLPEAWLQANEGENTMNALDIVGHLINGDRTDWIPRAPVILEKGESGTFEPFDRWGHKREIAGKSINALLDEFDQSRRESIAVLRALRLQPADLNRCARHPELGTVSLSELLATWAGHDLTHLHQISRVLANRYRQKVGPWSAYLGVLQCQGHSA